jgi:hypothetical protein
MSLTDAIIERNLVHLRDVHQDDRRLAAESVDFGLHHFDFFVAAFRVLCQHHMRACLRQTERYRSANALRGAGDNGNLVLQTEAQIVPAHRDVHSRNRANSVIRERRAHSEAVARLNQTANCSSDI